jgi:hypothetical protein
MRALWVALGIAATAALAAEPECRLLVGEIGKVRVENLSSLHSDLFAGPVLQLGEKYYSLPNVNHLTNRTGGAVAIGAWKQALHAARAAGPDAEALAKKTMSAMLVEYFTAAEGYTESYEIRTPGGRTTKFVLPDGTLVYLGKAPNVAAMRAIQLGLR